MKALPQRQLAIPFVLDRHHRHHDVDTLNLRDIHALPDGRHAFRCAACLEPVGVRAGVIRQPFFAHFPDDDATPPCPWRTNITPAAFHGRNPTGDDGKWHIDAQCQIMTILGAMGCHPARNASAHTPSGLRKPDIAVTIDRQLVHFEVQASPTSAWCAERRIDRDHDHRAVTIWIVSADAFDTAVDAGTLPTWVDTLAAMGNGQIWLWNDDCYNKSRNAGRLNMLRSTIDKPGTIEPASFPDDLPRLLPVAVRRSHAGRTRLQYPNCVPIDDRGRDNLSHLRRMLADELKIIADRLGQSFRFNYAIACINTPVPSYRIADGERHDDLRRWFDRQPRLHLATINEPTASGPPRPMGGAGL